MADNLDLPQEQLEAFDIRCLLNTGATMDSIDVLHAQVVRKASLAC
jgi:hypothetical protein